MSNPCARCGSTHKTVMLTMRTYYASTHVYLCDRCLQVLRNNWALFIKMGEEDVNYGTVDEMFVDVVNDLLKRSARIGSRDGACREQLGYAATLVDPSRCFLQDRAREASPHYAAAEFLWYMSGTDDISLIERFAPQYRRFAPDGRAYGAYGKRVGWQLDEAIRLLKDDVASRQCVLSMWSPSDLLAAARKQLDIPCTLSLQLLLRDDRLHVICTMRSNDVWLGLPYDVFCFCTLQRLLAWELGVELGYYHHRAGSVHLYDRNAERAGAVFGVEETLPSWQSVHDTLAGLRQVAKWYSSRSALIPPTDRTLSYSLVTACEAADDASLPIDHVDQPLRAAIERRRK